MKKIIHALTALSALAAPLSAASAQRWQPINQRQNNLYSRIEQGVRNGSLTRGEAERLRGRFVALDRLEQRYRRDGLSPYERQDLQRRFDGLSRDIRYQRHDNQDRRYR